MTQQSALIEVIERILATRERLLETGIAKSSTVNHQLAFAIIRVLTEHFQITDLELTNGQVSIKSDNHVSGTSVSVGNTILGGITHIEWVMDPEEGFGTLCLEFE